MDRLVEKERPETLHMLDLAAGSGEVTEVRLAPPSRDDPLTFTDSILALEFPMRGL